MSVETKIPEKVLYEVWKTQKFKNDLKTADGEEISVIDSGSLNEDTGGPDFKGARIRIGNLTYVGDIEIDRHYSDWKSHGHNIDNKYNSVILHLTLFNYNNHVYVYSRNGRKVPSVCLSQYVEKPFLEKIAAKEKESKKELGGKLKCVELNGNISPEVKMQFLSQLGAERFKKKCKKVFDRLKEIQFLNELGIKEPVVAYDLTEQFHDRKFKYTDFASQDVWLQLFYELIFEALGYSKNKLQMMSLAQAANLNFVKRIENDGILVEKYEAALLYVSGLAQSIDSVTDCDSKEYITKLQSHWNSIQSFYDGNTMDETQWHFFKLRPQNFPTIRIAGGARILREILYGGLIKNITKKITEIYNLTVLINALRTLFVIRSDGFWRHHYVFDQQAHNDLKYFVGASRADEIVVNVLLPYFSVYFEVFGQQKQAKKVHKIYSLYQQRTENQIIQDVAGALNLDNSTKSTIISQGMIDLFRNYCSKDKCLECEIGKRVFD